VQTVATRGALVVVLAPAAPLAVVVHVDVPADLTPRAMSIAVSVAVGAHTVAVSAESAKHVPASNESNNGLTDWFVCRYAWKGGHPPPALRRGCRRAGGDGIPRDPHATSAGGEAMDPSLPRRPRRGTGQVRLSAPDSPPDPARGHTPPVPPPPPEAHHRPPRGM